MFALNRLSILMNWIVVWEHEGLMQRRERELVDDHLKITSRFGSSAKIRHPGLRPKSIGAKAIGALAVGALAIGRLVRGSANAVIVFLPPGIVLLRYGHKARDMAN